MEFFGEREEIKMLEEFKEALIKENVEEADKIFKYFRRSSINRARKSVGFDELSYDELFSKQI